MRELLQQSQSSEASRTARAADPLLPLVDAALAGDRPAYNQLLLQLAPHLLSVARRSLGAEHPEVRDVAQEAAWGVVEALPRFRRESTIVHFACRVALLTAMNVHRRQSAEQRKLQSLMQLREVTSEQEAAMSEPNQILSRARCVAAVRELMGRLPEAQAEALGLHHVVGLTSKEIHELTGVPLETVRSRLKRAKQELRRVVAHDARLAQQLGVRHVHVG